MSSRPVLLTAVLVLASACTTTQQMYTGPRLPIDDGVVLRESRLRDADERMLEPWNGTPKDPSIYVRTINGESVSVYASEFQLQPGKYEVGVVGTLHGGGRDQQLAEQRLQFDAKPGGEYELRGALTGIGSDYVVSVWDLREKKEVARSK